MWVARQEWFDLNVCLVGGADGLLVVDTQASARAARAIVEDVRALGIGDVTASYASRNAPLPKVWSKCSWVLTTAVTGPTPRRADVVDDRPGRRGRAWVSTTSRPAIRRPGRR